MKRSEALKLLELEGHPSDDEVNEAWRKVIRKVHPDLYPNDPAKRKWAENQSALVNEARDVLIRGSWDPENSSRTARTAYSGTYSSTGTQSNPGSSWGSSQRSGGSGGTGGSGGPEPNPGSVWKEYWSQHSPKGSGERHRAKKSKKANQRDILIRAGIAVAVYIVAIASSLIDYSGPLGILNAFLTFLVVFGWVRFLYGFFVILEISVSAKVWTCVILVLLGFMIKPSTVFIVVTGTIIGAIGWINDIGYVTGKGGESPF